MRDQYGTGRLEVPFYRCEECGAIQKSIGEGFGRPMDFECWFCGHHNAQVSGVTK